MAPDSFIAWLEQELDSQINFVVRHFQTLPDSAMVQRPSPDAWSMVECIEHLNTYSDYYMPLMRRAIEEGSLDKTKLKPYAPGFLGDLLNRKIDPVRGKKRLKARAMHLPKINEAPSQIVARHLAAQEELIVLVRRSQNLNLNKKVIPLSWLKWVRLSLGDTYAFMVYHNARHLNQAGAQIDFLLK